MKTLEILQIEVENLKKLNNELALKNNQLSGEVERLRKFEKQWMSVKDEKPEYDQLYDIAIFYQGLNRHIIKEGYIFKSFHPNKKYSATDFFQKPKYLEMGIDEELWSLDIHMITHFRPHVPVPKI